MKLKFGGEPWPPWTVERFYPMASHLRFKYSKEGEDVVLEQYMLGHRINVTRECRFSSEADLKVLRWEAGVLGIELNTIQDLEELSRTDHGMYFALHATDDDGQPIVVILPNVAGLDPAKSPEYEFATEGSTADDAIGAAAERPSETDQG